MITYDDLLARFPKAADFDRETVQAEINLANNALPDERFRESPDYGRMLFVMHRLERPPVAADMASAAKLARGVRSGAVRMPHPWSGTEHGEALRKMAR